MTKNEIQESSTQVVVYLVVIAWLVALTVQSEVVKNE